MRAELNQIEKIERYLTHKLSTAECTAFETEMASNEELDGLVSAQLLVQQAAMRKAIRSDVMKYGAAGIGSWLIVKLFMKFFAKTSLNLGVSTAITSVVVVVGAGVYVATTNYLENQNPKDQIAVNQPLIITEDSTKTAVENQNNSLEKEGYLDGNDLDFLSEYEKHNLNKTIIDTACFVDNRVNKVSKNTIKNTKNSTNLTSIDTPKIDHTKTEESVQKIIWNPINEVEKLDGYLTINGYKSNIIHLSKKSFDSGEEIKIWVEFEVETTGEISEVKITKGYSIELDNAVKEFVESLPKWSPLNNGPKSMMNDSVKVNYEIPVIFKMNK